MSHLRKTPRFSSQRLKMLVSLTCSRLHESPLIAFNFPFLGLKQTSPTDWNVLVQRRQDFWAFRGQNVRLKMFLDGSIPQLVASQSGNKLNQYSHFVPREKNATVSGQRGDRGAFGFTISFYADLDCSIFSVISCVFLIMWQHFSCVTVHFLDFMFKTCVPLNTVNSSSNQTAQRILW